MSKVTSSRAATVDEIAAEMDRRGTVIENLEATIAKLTAERDTALQQRDAATAERDEMATFSAKTSSDLEAARTRARIAEARAKNAEALVASSDTVIARMARSLFYVSRICDQNPHSVVEKIAEHAGSWLEGDAGDSTLDAAIYTRFFSEERPKKRTNSPAAARAEERERCAKVLDAFIERYLPKRSSKTPSGQKLLAVVRDLAWSIRQLP